MPRSIEEADYKAVVKLCRQTVVTTHLSDPPTLTSRTEEMNLSSVSYGESVIQYGLASNVQYPTFVVEGKLEGNELIINVLRYWVSGYPLQCSFLLRFRHEFLGAVD